MRHRFRLVASAAACAASLGVCLDRARAWPTLEWVSDTFDTARAVNFAFDPERAALVARDSSVASPTWEWSGGVWQRRANPATLAPFVFAVDQHALIGLGYEASSNDPSLWRYNGTSWTQLASSGPSFRIAYSQVYDAARGALVVFGGLYYPPPGSTAVYLNDTWEWNGVAWAQLATTGPVARRDASLFHDADRGVVVLFGGRSDAGSLNDTWLWDGQAWSQPTPTVSPPVANLSRAAFDTVRRVGVVVMSVRPDMNSPLENQTWEWDGSNWARGVDPPPQLLVATAVWDDPGGGGIRVLDDFYTNLNVSDAEPGRQWLYNGASWTPVTAGAPAARAVHGMTYDSVRHRVLLGPGEPGYGLQFDAWAFDGSRWVFENSRIPELARRNYAMTFDRARGAAVLFGGVDSGGVSSKTVEWDGVDWVDQMVAGPPVRLDARLVYDEARAVSVLFGGWANSGATTRGDTWEWDGAQWTQKLITAPLPRYAHAMAYDSSRGVVVLFGGRRWQPPSGPFAYVNDTWEYDGVAWTMRSTPVAPAPRAFGAMAYDRQRHVIVLQGGLNGPPGGGGTTVFEDVWEWDGTVWRQVDVPNGPGTRYDHAMAYDEARHEVVLFGGVAGISEADTWRLRLRPCPADLDGDENVGAADLAQMLGSWGMDTPADQNGDGVVNAADLALLLGAWGACAE